MKKIGFIGTGNMGSALARAVCKSQGGGAVILANRTRAKAEALAEELSCRVWNNQVLAEQCEYIFLGVKPQMMAGMLADIAPTLAKRRDRFILVSMAAGIPTRRIQEMAGGNYPVIWVMPNTPANIGAGVLPFCSRDTTDAERAFFQTLLAPAGLVDPLDEHLMDAASAVAGSAPAFTYLYIEALADGGVASGLPRDKALSYAAQMVIGSGRMVLESGEHPELLKDKVCSPAGSTIQGIRTLERQGFRSAVFEAVVACVDRLNVLAKS